MNTKNSVADVHGGWCKNSKYEPEPEDIVLVEDYVAEARHYTQKLFKVEV